MSAIHRLLKPLRNAAAAFFKHDVTLARQPDGVRVTLKERPKPKPAKQARAEVAVSKEKQELAQIRAELAALLNELPETRQTMRHLVFVEHALAKKGLRALHKVPLDVLQRALDQLEGLVTNWSPEGLANLRSKMAVAIMEREQMEPQAEADAPRPRDVPELRDALPSPSPVSRSEDEALAAAYAALGPLAPPTVSGAPLEVEEGVQMQAELGARSRRSIGRPSAVDSGYEVPVDIQLRELQR